MQQRYSKHKAPSDFSEYVPMSEMFPTAGHLCSALNWLIKVQKREMGTDPETVFPFRKRDEDFSPEDVARNYLYWYATQEYEYKDVLCECMDQYRLDNPDQEEEEEA